MTQERQDPGFSDVDRAADSHLYITCLDEQYKTGLLQWSKQRTLALLDIQPDHQVLDAGCGTGVDALEMAKLVGDTGHITGVDLSERMIAAANERSAGTGLPVTFQQANLYELPFDEGHFDRCRSDKTFQHLATPRQVLQELIRVVKPGGRLVIADPDHESLATDTPYPSVNRRFVHFRSDAMTQGRIAHQMFGLFKEYGLVDVTAASSVCRPI